MPIYGLTGSIGTGKTTVSNMIADLGWDILDTDLISRELTRAGTVALNEIVNVFGSVILTDSGELNRPALAEIVFNDPAELRKLEAILHRRIRAAWKSALSKLHNRGSAKVLVVIPLLYETRAQADFEKVVCVGCSRSHQLNRLRSRGWTDSHISNRLASQMDLGQKMDRSDYLVWNEYDLNSTSAQVLRIFNN